MIISRHKLAIAHISFWLLYISFALLSFGYLAGLDAVLRETLFSYAISIGTFYAHYHLLKLLLTKKQFVTYILSLLLLLAFNTAIKNIVFLYLWPMLFDRPSSVMESGTGLDYAVIIYTWQASTFLILSTGYWAAERLLSAEKERRQKDRLELENVALRAQINPHFMVNSLVYLASETEEKVPHVSQFAKAMGIYMQSSIIITNKNGMVALDDEMDALEALVFIQQKRFPNAKIFYKKSVPSGLEVAPHTLTPFVENAIKHGSFVDQAQPMCVTIEYLDGSLYFYCFNMKGSRYKDKSRGIGLQYVKRQLESAFEGQYNLAIEDNEKSFAVNLRIDNLKTPNQHEHQSIHY